MPRVRRLGHICPACPKRGGRRSKFNKWRRSTSDDKKDAKDKTKDEKTKERKAGRKNFARHRREFANALLAEAAAASDSDSSVASSSVDESNSKDHAALTADMGLNAMLASLKE